MGRRVYLDRTLQSYRGVLFWEAKKFHEYFIKQHPPEEVKPWVNAFDSARFATQFDNSPYFLCNRMVIFRPKKYETRKVSNMPRHLERYRLNVRLLLVPFNISHWNWRSKEQHSKINDSVTNKTQSLEQSGHQTLSAHLVPFYEPCPSYQKIRDFGMCEPFQYGFTARHVLS